MPVPHERDATDVAAALQVWMRKNVSDDIIIDGVDAPQGQGNANETFLFTAHVGAKTERLVLRVAPSVFPVFMNSDFSEQVAVLRCLGERTSLPVPTVRWFDDNETWFGASFFIMDALEGLVPPDRPSYNSPDTWTAHLSTTQQQTLWENAVDALCAIHTDPGRSDVAAILRHRLKDRDGMREQLDYWSGYRTEWAGGGSDLLDRTADWLNSNLPASRCSGLSWGDARLENMMFDGELRCVGILDWEMASLGGPLLDLGWWLFCDAFAERTFDTPRLPGLGTRTQTCERWTQSTGIATDDLPWYEIFAGYRLSAIIMKMMRMWSQAWGFQMPEGFNDLDNGATRLLRELLEAQQ